MTIYSSFVKYLGYKDEYNKILHPQRGSRLADDSFHKYLPSMCRTLYYLDIQRALQKKRIYIYLLKRNSSELLSQKTSYFLDFGFIYYVYLRRFSNLGVTIIILITAIGNKFPEHLQPKSEYSLFSSPPPPSSFPLSVFHILLTCDD